MHVLCILMVAATMRQCRGRAFPRGRSSRTVAWDAYHGGSAGVLPRVFHLAFLPATPEAAVAGRLVPNLLDLA